MMNDRLACISIVLLTNVQVQKSLRSNLPETSDLTIGDKFMMVYIITSILPLIHLIGSINKDPIHQYTLEEDIDRAATWVAFGIYLSSGIYLFVKWS